MAEALSTNDEMKVPKTPNKPDASNPAIASRFHAEYQWRGVADPGRWVGAASLYRLFTVSKSTLLKMRGHWWCAMHADGIYACRVPGRSL